MFSYRTVQGPLYLALAFQIVILALSFFGDTTRAMNVASGCAACSIGLLLRTLLQLRRSRE
jgi:hypothetical protein